MFILVRKYILLSALSMIAIAPLSMQAQRNVQLFMPFAIQGGGSLAKIERDSLNKWGQGIGNAVGLNIGLGATYLNFVNISLNGGFTQNTYRFFNQGLEYNISSFVSLAFVNVNARWPLSKQHNSFFQVGTDLGYIFHGSDTKNYASDEFNAFSESFGPKRFFIAPEFGISKQEKRFNLSILATFSYTYGDEKVIQTMITDNQGTLTATSRGNFFGIKLRGTYTLAGHLEPINLVLPAPSNKRELESRNYTDIASISIKKKTLHLKVADVGQIDNDSISIIVNGQYLLTYHQLTNEREKLKIRLKKGVNEIYFIAHNEGTVPPNTARVYLRSGRKKWNFPVSTKLESNARIIITVE